MEKLPHHQTTHLWSILNLGLINSCGLKESTGMYNVKYNV